MQNRWLALLTLVIPMTSSAYDEPQYQVLKSTQDSIELRLYAPYAIAEIAVDGEFDDVGSQAFRPLFNYISGNNTGGTKLAMTVPVGREPEPPAQGQKLAMAVPVIQEPAGKQRYLFHFVLPLELTAEKAPRPLDDRIHIRQVAARKVAVLRYSGTTTEGKFREKEKLLRDWMSREGLQPAGPALQALYNAPWTLWFMRRNEVMIPVLETPANP
jgi:hypothetical protein